MAKGDGAKAGTPAAGSKYVVLEARSWEPSGHEGEGPPTDCWVEVGAVDARDRAHAVRVHTGDGADVREGTFKAVPLASWRGSVVTSRVTTASRKVID